MNDSLENLFVGDTGPVRTSPVRESTVEFKGAVERFEEKCTKCRGTGKFTGWSGRMFGECFTCKGAGKFTFKTAPEVRAQARTAEAARKATREQEAIEAFKSQNQAAYEWLVATAPRWDLAASLLAGLHRYGSLTEKQMAIVTKGIERDAARGTERAARVTDAPAVDTAGIDRLKLAFDKARAYASAKGPGLAIRNPKITIGGITISPAKADSKNAGALYVKDGGVYVGKIAGGKFYSANANGDEAAAKVLKFISNPADAAKVYGQETGICCVCNATLKSKWRLRGIGPVCAEKMGWAGLAEAVGVDL
jgi:hypothetical protein